MIIPKKYTYNELKEHLGEENAKKIYVFFMNNRHKTKYKIDKKFSVRRTADDKFTIHRR